MNLAKKIYHLNCDLVEMVFTSLAIRHEKNIINSEHKKKIRQNYVLTSQQRKEVDSFYKMNFGSKVPYAWHEYYSAITEKFDYKYVPDTLLRVLERRMNSSPDVKVLNDKFNQYLLLKGYSFIKIPHFYGAKRGNIYLDSTLQAISFDKFAEYLVCLHETIVIKPCLSESGRGVILVNPFEAGLEELKRILSSYKDDFKVEGKVTNHSSISCIYPHALNTIRIITYRLNGHIYFCPLLMRCGKDGLKVDNCHAGGIFIGLTNEGNLLPCAHIEDLVCFYSHPNTGFVFENAKVFGVDRAVQAVINIHSTLKNLNLLYWDVAINEEGEPCVIEVACSSGSFWLPQIAHGKGLFGDNTSDILKFIKNRYYR